jgi:hypothetical protein
VLVKRYGRLTVIVTSILISAAAFTVAVLYFVQSRVDRPLLAQIEDYDSINAVPVDASAILFYPHFQFFYDEFSSGKTLFGRVLMADNVINQFIEKLSSILQPNKSSAIKDSDCVLSLHYSAKDKVSPLFIIKLDITVISAILTALKTESDPAGRVFNGIRIGRLGAVEYATSGGLLMASDSPMILESSIRHILSGNSAAGITEFATIFSQTDLSNGAIFFNHSQSGKLFSGFTERAVHKFAGFVSVFTGWSSFGIKAGEDNFFLAGGVNNNRGGANYSSLFSQAKGRTFNAARVVPSTTFAILTISAKDIRQHIKKFEGFREFSNKRDPAFQRDAERWFFSLDATEISCAILPFGGKHEGVTIIGKKRRSSGFIKRLLNSESAADSVAVFPYKGYIPALFGQFFSNTYEESVLETPEWIFIGRESLLRELFAGGGLSFSMHDYILQTKAHNLLDSRDCMLSLIVNGSHEVDSLMRFFKKSVRVSATKSLSGSNIMIGSFQIKSGENGAPRMELYAYADSVETLPYAPKLSSGIIFGVDADTVVRIPSGPFELINFNNGEKEYLEQLPGNWLRLTDKDRKPLWSVPFPSKVRGMVRQIDFFRNGKMQMLFANESSIYMLDRLGRFVSPYPKRLEREILLGPELYDLKGDGEYAVMILHVDNNLSLYDRLMRPYPAWKDISIEERIKEFPILFESGGNRYWILRSGKRTIIYTINGNPVMERSEKIRLRADTPVEPVGDGVVRVITTEGKKIFLNLETGNINRRR